MYKSRNNREAIIQLKKIYGSRKKEIVSRLREFEQSWLQKSEKEILGELIFCLLTPQSRAKFCWDAIVALKEQNLLLKGTAGQIKKRLHCVRFHNKKAQYVIEARNLFIKNGRVSIKPLLNRVAGIQERREWLVKNIKGLGYKEASHFLRNMGFGESIAILDRHILRNLHLLSVIEGIPESLSRTKYLLIEKKMAEFAKEINIPLAHLDLLLWYKETGEIFK
jgi:N-glycosylase/DNA lyase